MIGTRKRNFIGWRSEELSDFLVSVGKDSDEPISQFEVCDIIFKYIQDRKLGHPTKRKKVLCDPLLRALFRRKEVNRLRISKLLDPHFADNQLFEEDASDLWFSEDFVYKQKSVSHGAKIPNSDFDGSKGQVLDVPRNAFASITAENIKLVYLRRSSVVKFLKNPDIFEDRMVGSIVRVKSEITASNASKNLFQLVLVTGVAKLLRGGGIGETTTDFVLRAADIANDIRITMISDDDFSEEECDELRQRVKQGLVRRLTVMELDSKARSLHKDITSHWIDQEIAMLQNQIDRANEKGWRRELFEYVERKELLETPEERSRLLAQPIIVAADLEVEFEANLNDDEYSSKKQGDEVAPIEVDEDREDDDNGLLTPESPKMRGRKKGSKLLQGFAGKQDNALKDNADIEDKNMSVVIEDAFLICPQKELWTAVNAPEDATPDHNGTFEAVSENHQEGKAEGNSTGQWIAEGRNIVIEIDKSDHENVNSETQKCDVEVIDIDDDDDNGDESQKEDKSQNVAENQFIWHYKDPNGDIQGPFPKKYLRSWKEKGYFDENFRVWRSGQELREAILLNDLLH